MARQRYKVDTEWLDDRTVRFSVSDVDGAMSWRRMLAGWLDESGPGDVLARALADLPFVAFRWETPAMTADRLDRVFECVAVDDPSLDVGADPSPFAEHLRGDRAVVRFANLGGDAVMVVPCRQVREDAYAHIAAFLRRARRDQQRALWREVAAAMCERLKEPLNNSARAGRAFAGDPLRFASLIWNDQTTLAEATTGHPAKTPSRPRRVFQRFLNDRPVWLSTAGGGVAWLHVRLDDRPKYYAHAPYRTASGE